MTTQKRIAVFGASGGIGSTLVRRLQSDGYAIAAIQRGNFPDESAQVHPLPLEASTWDGFVSATQAAAEALGGLDGVVNCIGGIVLKPIHLTRESDFDNQVLLHLKSSAAILSAAMPLLRQSDHSDRSVVLISSIAASRGLANHELISAVKAGIEGLARSAAATYARQGIRINTVAPGLTRTSMTERIWSSEAACRQAEKNHALGRLGEPDDIANAIAWLLSENSRWVTGTTLHVDGGMSQVQNLVS